LFFHKATRQKVESVDTLNSRYLEKEFYENVRRTEIVRASSGASGLLMMVMQSCFHAAAISYLASKRQARPQDHRF
jgi:hypothetical protein